MSCLVQPVHGISERKNQEFCFVFNIIMSYMSDIINEEVPTEALKEKVMLAKNANSKQTMYFGANLV